MQDRRIAAAAVAVLVMIVGLLFRLPLRGYQGPPDAGAFNLHSYEHLGSYSDIATLYFRDALWEHPTPYVERDLEYPVLTGAYVWAASFVNDDVWSYLVVSWIGLAACGAAIAILLGSRRGSDPWLFCCAPALALYVVLNWDLLSLAATVAALVLFERRRDEAAAAALVVAIWTKLFPLLLLPLMLIGRWAEGDKRGAGRLAAVVAVGSAVVNLPMLLAAPEGWAFVFRFNRDRPRELNIWNVLDPISTSTINLWSTLLILAGTVAACWWVAGSDSGSDSRSRAVAPTFLALLAWAFFLGKVYSPQYSLWIVALLAYVGASRPLSVAFMAVDVGYFAASFVVIRLGTVGASDWFFDQVLWPAMLVREAALLVVVVAALWLAGRTRPVGALQVT